MSRIHDALHKLQQERALQPGTPPPAKNASAGLHYAVISLFLAAVAAGSLFVNFKTLSVLGRSNAHVDVLAGYLEEQKNELRTVREALAREQAGKEKQLAALEQKIRELRGALAKREGAFKEIEGMKVNNRLLLEKFIALNDKVKKLSEVNGK